MNSVLDDGAAYEARNAAAGLCTRCGENAPLPEEEWCGACTLEVEMMLAELEEPVQVEVRDG